MIILHVGLPKTGTTSIQRALDSNLPRATYTVFTNQHTAADGNGCNDWGWEAAGLQIDGATLQRATSRSAWHAIVTNARAARRDGKIVVISHESLCMADRKAVQHIAAELRPDIVIVTETGLWRLLKRRHRELGKFGAHRRFAVWAATLLPPRLGWPNPDAVAVLPRVVARRWMRTGCIVRRVDTTTDAITNFCNAAGLPAMPERYDNTRQGPA